MKIKENKQETKEPITRLYTAKEAAKLWGITYWNLRSLVEQRKIRPIIGIGKGWKFTGNEIGSINFERL